MKNKVPPPRSNRQAVHFRCLKFVLGIFLGGMGLVAAANYLIDPYAVYHTYHYCEIYQMRPVADNTTRLQKEAGIIREKPARLLFGASTVNHGMDVYEPGNQKVLQDFPGVYNAGVSGNRISESRRLLEHAIANNQHIEWVVVSLEALFFRTGYGDDTDGKEFESVIGRTSLPRKIMYKTLLSWDAVHGSWITTWLGVSNYVKEHRKNISTDIQNHWGFAKRHWPWRHKSAPPDPLTYPMLTPADPEDERAAEDKMQIVAFTEWYLMSKWQESAQKHDENALFNEGAYDEVQKISDLCKEHNIKLYLFVSPHTATLWQGFSELGIYGWYQDWIRRVAAIHPVWDFSHYEPFLWNRDLNGNFAHYFWGDPLHYAALAGGVMLDNMLHDKKDDIYVTEQNVEVHLKRNKAHLDQWQAAHPYMRDALHGWQKPLSKDMPGSVPDSMPKWIDRNYKGYSIFLYIGTYYGLPAQSEPYDLLKLRQGSYKPVFKAATAQEVRAQINALKE